MQIPRAAARQHREPFLCIASVLAASLVPPSPGCRHPDNRFRSFLMCGVAGFTDNTSWCSMLSATPQGYGDIQKFRFSPLLSYNLFRIRHRAFAPVLLVVCKTLIV